jgi:DNA-binding MarR family transcriptional regulator
MKAPITEDAVRAWARLLRASQTALASVEGDLKAAGLPPLPWYDVLLELLREESGRLRPFEIQERVLLSQYNVSRLIDRLEAKGYVERLPCDEDGRGQLVAISGAGERLLGKMWPVYASAIARHFADKLSPRETAVLDRLLAKLY